MIVRPFFLLLIVPLLFLSKEGYAQARPEQEDTVNYRIETDDGNVYIGSIISQKPGYILLKTISIGTITVQFDRIVKMERVTVSEHTEERRLMKEYSRPQETTYHFTPNGYGLRKGEGYYQNSYLFINQFYVGITDYFSLGGGLVPVPVDGTPVWVTPKFSVPIVKDKVNMGIGSVNAVTLGTNSESFGMFYTNITFGSRERNFSIGAGKGYHDGFDGRLAFSVSGAYKLGEDMYLITENYTISGISVGTIGGRYVWPGVSLECSIIYLYEYDLFMPIPYVGVIVPFGHSK